MIVLLVILLDALAIAAMAGIIVIHFLNWRKARKGMGILPVHVVVIASAQILFLVNSSTYALETRDTSAMITHIVALILTLAALVIIGEYQRRRMIVRNKKEIRDSLNR